MIKEQKYLKKWGLILYVSILAMAPSLSTDMYMPSLPAMAVDFNTSELMVNVTLIVFFLFMAIGMLIFGPVSDKYGRRRPLLIGLAMYAVGSIGCAVSGTIGVMITLRCIQSLGAGSMVSLSMAIVKDSFEGRLRDDALAMMQGISIIAPIAAPVIGALILRVATWRMVFIVLSVIAVACFILGLIYQESLDDEHRTQGMVTDTFVDMGKIAKDINFMPFLLMASVYSAPFIAYLAVASYTYEEFFGLSSSMFAVFFAINAAFTMLGPALYIRVNGVVPAKWIVRVLMGFGFVFAVLVYVFGEISPVAFLCCFIPYGVANSFMRPFSSAILLAQQDNDAGAASALFNFCYTMFSALGMLTGSLGLSSYVHALGVIIFVFTLLSFLIWTFVSRSRKIHMKHM